MNSTGWPRWRSRRWSIAAMVVSVVCVSSATMLAWLDDSLFDSRSFARRAGAALDSPAVQHELALQLTDQLIVRGNREVTAFRPAAVLAAEALIATDTFHSIFVRSVRETHQALLNGTSAGLDLSESLDLLATSLRLTAEVRQPDSDSPGALDSIIDSLQDHDVWTLRKEAETALVWSLVIGVLLAGLSVLLAVDRRRSVGRLGFGVAVGGLGIAGSTALAARLAEGISEASHLREAVHDAVWSATADLRALGIAVCAAAVAAAAAAYAPDGVGLRSAYEWVAIRVARWRSTRFGAGGLAVSAAVGGMTVIGSPGAAAATAMVALGLALLYSAVRLAVSFATPLQPVGRGPREATRFANVPWLVVGAVSVLATVVAADLFVTNSRANAEDAEEFECLGSIHVCDLPLDRVTLAGAHNAMSSSAYPGWLFGEQTRTVRQQLNEGVRALLIDAHYGRRSSIVVPGSDTPLVLTDVAAELAVPGSEVPDPLLRERAEQLAAAAPAGGAGARDVYLCHNFCELGAVRMADELREVRRFLDEHPDEIVVIVVQNAVSADDVHAAFEEAGLVSRAAVLSPEEPLPTVGDLVHAGTQLLVFAERPDDDAADWYMPMYDWFQETPYTWASADEFTCEPNRGSDDNPFLLVNHWVSRAPPDPGVARAANAQAVLEARFEECVAVRGVRATVIAADFATSGDLIRTTRGLTDEEADALLSSQAEP